MLEFLSLYVHVCVHILLLLLLLFLEKDSRLNIETRCSSRDIRYTNRSQKTGVKLLHFISKKKKISINIIF